MADRGAWRNFDLAPDGKRFAVTNRLNSQEDAAPKNEKFVVPLNPFDELLRVASPSRK